MGFFKKLFGGDDEQEKELDAARVRHGIAINEVDKKEMDKRVSEDQRMAEEYDVWEDLKNYRSNWLFGAWLNKKFHPIGEEKVRKELAELEQKRKAQEEKNKGEA